MICSYASCGRPGHAFRDGWALCRSHIVVHDEEKVGGEVTKTRDGGGRPIRENGTTTKARVAELHAQGLRDRDMAALLDIGRTTVRQHRKSMGLPPNDAPKKTAECGTRAGRMRHRDRGEQACQPCIDADRAWHRANWRRKQVA